MTPDEQYELRRSLKRKKALHKKPSMGPNMRKPAAVSAGAGGDGASSPVRKTPHPKERDKRKQKMRNRLQGDLFPKQKQHSHDGKLCAMLTTTTSPRSSSSPGSCRTSYMTIGQIKIHEIEKLVNKSNLPNTKDMSLYI